MFIVIACLIVLCGFLVCFGYLRWLVLVVLLLVWNLCCDTDLFVVLIVLLVNFVCVLFDLCFILFGIASRLVC